MKPFSLLIIAILALSGCAPSSEKYDLSKYREICEEFDELAIEQKAMLDQIRAKYNADKSFIARFNQEQISWIQYQDKRLRSLYPKDWDTFYRKNYGKSTFNGCKCIELIRLSKIRNSDLKNYLEGPNGNQQDCPIQGNDKGA